MKKIMIFITLFLIPFTIFADETTKFSLSEATASPGKNVTINLNMDNNQQFGVLTAKIYYDNKKLTYISSELKGLNNSALNGVDKNEDKGLIAIYAINLSKNKLMKDNGNILTIEFLINENVTEDIPLSLEIKDFGYVDGSNLNYEIQNGLIHIKNDIETVSQNKKTSIIDSIKEQLEKQGLNKSDITLSSTNDNVATVDEEGNIEFKNDGNASIIVKDTDGNTIYSKEYFVKSTISNNKKLLIPIILFLLVIFTIIIIIRRKKCQKVK